MSDALRVEGLGFSIGEQSILEGVSLRVSPGETVGIIGPNGSGKTTMFNCISGFYRGARGRIWLGETEVSAMSADERARSGLARVFQEPGIFREMTVIENMLLAEEGRQSTFRRVASLRSQSEASLKVLEEAGLKHAVRRKASVLSGGQLRVLELLRAMVFGATVFLLDEPTAGVAPRMKDQVVTLIRKLSQGGRAVLVIEHDIGFIESFCDRLLVLDVGKIVLEGKPSEVKRNPLLQEIYFGGSAA